MARADLLVELIKSASSANYTQFHKVVENLIAEERRKGKHLFADRMNKALRPVHRSNNNSFPKNEASHPKGDLFYQISPERSLASLFLTPLIENQIKEIIEEQHRSELLHSHSLKARHRLLFTGKPGNGKTTLAEAIAYELMYPLIVIRYESLIGSYLGETSGRIKAVLEYAKTQRCVLFFDEFETLGKERGDRRETGEIKRIVSSLLLQTDTLPDYVVLIAASNHPELLDKAVWRRFQERIELPPPTQAQLSNFIQELGKRCQINFGDSKILAKKLQNISYAEAEEFCLDIARRVVLERTGKDVKSVISQRLQYLCSQVKPISLAENPDE